MKIHLNPKNAIGKFAHSFGVPGRAIQPIATGFLIETRF